MPIPNSITGDPIFNEVQPDWSKDVDYVVSWETAISSGFDGAEQRARLLSSPRYQLTFRADGTSIPSYSIRRASAELELGRPVVVPLWPRPSTLSSLAAQVATISGPPSKRPYKVGSFAYFVEDGLTSVFAEILALDATTITIAAGNAAFPDTTVPAYTSAAIVYPCIISSYKSNQADFEDVNVLEKSLIMSFSEL